MTRRRLPPRLCCSLSDLRLGRLRLADSPLFRLPLWRLGPGAGARVEQTWSKKPVKPRGAGPRVLVDAQRHTLVFGGGSLPERSNPGVGGGAFPFSPCASAHGDDASNAPSRSRVAVTCARDVAVQIHGRLAVLGSAGFRRFTGERRALPATRPGPPGRARLTRAGVTGRRREGRDHGTHVPRASRARPSDWRLRLSAR